jgi:peroxiredoxin
MGLDSLRVSQPFPAAALQRFGVKGKKAVLFFYDGDEKPSCKQQISAFNAASDDFKKEGVTIVGVRSALGGKSLVDNLVALAGGTSDEGEVIEKTKSPINFVVDEDDALRSEIGIEEDLFGILGAFTRATYVVDKSGYIVNLNTDQLDAASHAKVALAAAKKMQPPKGARTRRDMEKSLFNLGFAVPATKRR